MRPAERNSLHHRKDMHVNDDTATRIAEAINALPGTLGGRLIAYNIDTGDESSETWSADSRPPIAAPWHLFTIRSSTSPEQVAARFAA